MTGPGDFRTYFLSNDYRRTIENALYEDRYDSDITTEAILPGALRKKTVSFEVIMKQDGICTGLNVVKDILFFCSQRRKNIVFRKTAVEGGLLRKNTRVAYGKAPVEVILAAERTALNFLGHLSGVSTLTHKFVKIASGYGALIFDTRKTLPGLRLLEKYAVAAGGGNNHRFSLLDAVFIKDNHRLFYHDFEKLIKTIKNYLIFKQTGDAPSIIEVDREEEILPALKAGVDVVLLDNFTPRRIKKFFGENPVSANDKKRLEISGGISLKNVVKYLETGVGRISIGALTHSAPSLDFSLEITKKGTGR